MDLLERVKELCSEKGISQRKLEAELGLSNGASSKWNKSSPSGDVLQKIADYFNVTIDYLLGRTAFKNSFSLFEHWGYSAEEFEAAFDFGELLKKERELQGISVKDVSKALGITESDVNNIEEGMLPINYDWAEKYANFLGTSVTEIFINNGMSASLNDIPLELLHHYQEQNMTETEMVIAYTKFRHNETQDALKENLQPYNEINTIAAHHNGEEFTEEELEDIEKFKEFVKMRRGQKDNK